MNFRHQKFTLKCNDPDTYDECEPYEVILKKGKYHFECVGASGNSDLEKDVGYGARVTGVISLKEKSKLYIYVGGKGSTIRLEGKATPGGYNGGGNGGCGLEKTDTGRYYGSGFSGGGATDVRTINGAWNDPISLDSRIMVAGAGGAGTFSSTSAKGGDGGTIQGFPGYDELGNIALGANQTNGFAKGKGQDGLSKTVHGNRGAEGNSGAGGGWHGGFASQRNGDHSVSGAGGGSSFISGHEGLEVINNLKFDLTHMEGGNVTKHSGNGYVVITVISSCTSVQKSLPKSFIFTLLMLSTK